MSKSSPSREAILGCLRELGRPAHEGELRTRCGVARRDQAAFTEALHQLVADGSVAQVGNRYRLKRPSGRESESWEGIFGGHPRGFGFVAAVGKEDLYIPVEGVGEVMHGDTVKVVLASRSSRGAEGKILGVVSRRNARIAGTVRVGKKSQWLEPDDARIRGPIVLTSGEVPARDGEAAVASITRFPEYPGENPEGVLTAVLGQPGTAEAEIAKVLVREQVTEEHPPEAVREAEAMAVRLSRLRLGPERTDLREIPFLTIDPADARDHDDAVWVERTEAGFRVYVAIADVSEYVQAGTALDAEALRRGCTIYLPDRAVPMLPAALAADLCSLLPEKERYALCVIAEVDKNGKVTKFQVVEGLIRAAAMITYGSAARALGLTENYPKSPQAEAFKKDLKVIDELTRKLRTRRMTRGALDLDLPEAQVVLDEETGAVLDVKRRASDPGVKQAYRLVEELMLLANELVAQWLTKKKSPAIYRVHGKPDEQKLERLANVAEVLGVAFDVVEMQDAKGLGRFLARLDKHPKKNVLEMITLRSLKQAVYDITNVGHFGLASDAYLHFTSPIRRYPDLVVHRTVKALLRGAQPDASASAVERMRTSATTASARERAAAMVEREIVDLYRALLMRNRVGEIFEGTITSLVATGMYVALDAPFVDVLVRFEAMGPDRYELSEDELSIVGLRSGESIELGSRVTVEIEDVALLRRSVFARRVVVGVESVSEPTARALPPRGKPGPRAQGERGRPGAGARPASPARPFTLLGKGFASPKKRAGAGQRGAAQRGAAQRGTAPRGAVQLPVSSTPLGAKRKKDDRRGNGRRGKKR